MQKLGGDRVTVRTAGSDPAEEINPAAVTAMAEVGIDLTTGAAQAADDRRGARGGRGRDDGMRG